jgi:hypothetical protein
VHSTLISLATAARQDAKREVAPFFTFAADSRERFGPVYYQFVCHVRPFGQRYVLSISMTVPLRYTRNDHEITRVVLRAGFSAAYSNDHAMLK